jgi:23S rRNA (guanosine2251-2'-O)-methyltransferase
MENKTKDFIFGLRPVIEAIESGQTIDKVLVKKGLTGDLVKELYKAIADNNVPMQHVPVEKIEQITKKNHQGVLAFLSAVEFSDIDAIVSDVFSEGKNPFIVVLDQITDVRNLGSIIRSAECAGAHAVLVPTKGSARIGGDTVKTSAGALYHIPLCRTDSLPNQLKNLKRSGLQIICASEKTEEKYYNVDFTQPLVLVMGSEEFGITPDILRLGDSFARIPILGKVQSLNVSNAASVLMFEVVRQRIGL